MLERTLNPNRSKIQVPAAEVIDGKKLNDSNQPVADQTRLNFIIEIVFIKRSFC